MTVSLQVSPVLATQLQQAAQAAQVTVEEFLLLAAAEKIAALEHHQWLTQHDKSGGVVDPCGEG